MILVLLLWEELTSSWDDRTRLDLPLVGTPPWPLVRFPVRDFFFFPELFLRMFFCRSDMRKPAFFWLMPLISLGEIGLPFNCLYRILTLALCFGLAPLKNLIFSCLCILNHPSVLIFEHRKPKEPFYKRLLFFVKFL